MHVYGGFVNSGGLESNTDSDFWQEIYQKQSISSQFLYDWFPLTPAFSDRGFAAAVSARQVTGLSQ
jgi:hypothetical protein